MIRLCLIIALCAATFGALCAESEWENWAPRKEIMPRCYRDTVRFRSAPDSLAISGDSNAAAYGGWTKKFSGITVGQHYQFSAYFRSEGVLSENRQIVARIDWLKADGKRTGEPDYVYQVESADGEWKKLSLTMPAPSAAATAKVELLLGWAPQGTVWWDDISFEQSAPPKERLVRIGSLALRPKNMATSDASVAAFCEALDTIAADKPDIVCLGECITKYSAAEVVDPLD